MKLKVIIGAGEQRWDGWIPTGKAELDLLDAETWAHYFGKRKADAFLCEHVFEHLTVEEGRLAAATIRRYLKPGGFIRVAVPDRYFPDPVYQELVQVGGPGDPNHPAADHKVVYDYCQLATVFEESGFHVRLLEYHDEAGRFHCADWDASLAPVYRSSKLDHRNQDGVIRFASIILDAINSPESSGEVG